MASTNQTPNYQLSQYIGSDKPTYLGDYNADMLKIDTQMKKNADEIQTNKDQITIIGDTANTANTTANSAQTTATEANTTATSALNKANTNEADLSNIKSKSIMSLVPNENNVPIVANQDYYTQKLTNWYNINSKGTKITYDSENNSFRIGNGVSKVKVSANIGLGVTTTNTTVTAIISRNRNNNITNLCSASMSTQNEVDYVDEISMTPFLIDVQEGDLIELRIQIDYNGRSTHIRNNSYFTIEEV